MLLCVELHAFAISGPCTWLPSEGVLLVLEHADVCVRGCRVQHLIFSVAGLPRTAALTRGIKDRSSHRGGLFFVALVFFGEAPHRLEPSTEFALIPDVHGSCMQEAAWVSLPLFLSRSPPIAALLDTTTSDKSHLAFLWVQRKDALAHYGGKLGTRRLLVSVPFAFGMRAATLRA